MKRVLVAIARPNSASMTIRDALLRLHAWKESGASFEGHAIRSAAIHGTEFSLVECKNDVLALDHLRDHFSPDLYIIASTHRSSSNTKSLTVHATGNFANEARLGGSANEVCATSASFISNALEFMQKNAPAGYEITLEATHHGPSKMNAPLCFIEIGSTEVEWVDPLAGDVIAKAIFHGATAANPKESVLCIGGPHYCPNFMKPDVLSKYAIGHVVSKNVLDTVTFETLKQAIDLTVPRPTKILFDWKGAGSSQKERLKPMLDKLGLEVIKI